MNSLYFFMKNICIGHPILFEFINLKLFGEIGSTNYILSLCNVFHVPVASYPFGPPLPTASTLDSIYTLLLLIYR
jgi:hypothetical protein